jgi:2-dehydropantoate 2-reductase
MLGVLLAEAGHDVTLLASHRTSTAINVNGLTLPAQQPVRRAAGPAPESTVAHRTGRRPVNDGEDAGPARCTDLSSSAVPAQSGLVPLLNGVDHVPLLRAVLPQPLSSR